MNTAHSHSISVQQHTHQNKPSYQYLLSQPNTLESAKRYPLVLFLHGRGEIGGEIETLLNFGPNSYLKQHHLDAICITPHVPEGRDGWAIAELISLLDQLEQQFPIDKQRIYLTGLSMGGFGVTNLALAQPQRFAALSVLAAGDPNRLAPWSLNLPARPVCEELYQRLNQLPIWLTHGLKDSVIPAEFSVELAGKLGQMERQAPLQSTWYPQHEHNIWDDFYATSSFWIWLFEQTNPSPKSERQSLQDLSHLAGDYGNQHDYVSISYCEKQGLKLLCKDLQDNELSFSLYPVAKDLLFCEIGCLRFIGPASQTQLALTRLTLLDKLALS
ncbi:alpha/beta hydrolase-fold protein [Agarivorans aestuarii]|uniref:Alpha/beta hydrolase-fold protein n=1 Tax=Agarivorans aestuarii TaxID=1563703 RepID=A0ABU7G7S7_9ALTE|nr:alpha/beta hydrolase-fold protein [Agarivorans aestuarii]MEE1675272.1 alpha/beta hydrolase-fold protein [Agarivorans aestuarii]